MPSMKVSKWALPLLKSLSITSQQLFAVMDFPPQSLNLKPTYGGSLKMKKTIKSNKKFLGYEVLHKGAETMSAQMPFEQK